MHGKQAGHSAGRKPETADWYLGFRFKGLAAYYVSVCRKEDEVHLRSIRRRYLYCYTPHFEHSLHSLD